MGLNFMHLFGREPRNGEPVKMSKRAGTFVTLADVVEEGNRETARLIEDLLDMNRIASGKVRLDVQRTPLEPIIRAAIDACGLKDGGAFGSTGQRCTAIKRMLVHQAEVTAGDSVPSCAHGRVPGFRSQ